MSSCLRSWLQTLSWKFPRVPWGYRYHWTVMLVAMELSLVYHGIAMGLSWDWHWTASWHRD